MHRILYVVSAVVVFALASMFVGYVLRQTPPKNALIVDPSAADPYDPLMRIPFSRESCIEIKIQQVLKGERIEVDGTIVESSELESFLEAKVKERRLAVKALVFYVLITARSPHAAEATVRQVAMRHSLEVVRFMENSRTILSYL